MDDDNAAMMDDVSLGDYSFCDEQLLHSNPNRRRSVVWRVQLGLFLPMGSSKGDDNDGDERIDQEQQKQHRLRYQHLCSQYQYPSTAEDDRRGEVAAVAPSPSPCATTVSVPIPNDNALDPLSAMLQEEDEKLIRQQEIDKQYRKERALRKRGVNTEKTFAEEPDDAAAYVQLITKDLNRLPHPHVVVGTSFTTNNNAAERLQILQRVLFLFASTHANAGYLQGMHEIASYVLYALELENTATGTSSDTSDPATCQRNLGELEANCYCITERILTMLFAAYDVVAADAPNGIPHSNSAAKPLVQMSNRIVAQTASVWPNLHAHLQVAFGHIPSQLIFTKWIRLLFSRELLIVTDRKETLMPHQTRGKDGGAATSSPSCNTAAKQLEPACLADLVIKLWDALFQAAYEVSQQRQSMPPVTSSLQLVAEAFCVARLWEHGNTVLHLSQHPDLLLHWFMNVPPEPAAMLDSLVLRMRVVLQLPVANAVPPPPLPLSPEITALTVGRALPRSLSASTKAPASQQQHSRSSSSTLWENPGPIMFAAAAHPTLSSLTEKLAATSQSIQQRIAHEWENMQLQIEQQQQVVTSRQASPAKTTTRSHPNVKSDRMYNLDYYMDDPLRQYSNCGSNSNATAGAKQPLQNTNAPRPEPQQQQTSHWSYQLQSRLTVLQEFVVTVEQQSGMSVPRPVWEALADLQVLKQEMRKSNH